MHVEWSHGYQIKRQKLASSCPALSPRVNRKWLLIDAVYLPHDDHDPTLVCGDVCTKPKIHEKNQSINK